MNRSWQNENEVNLVLNFKRPHKITAFGLSLIFVGIIGITDYISGYEMSFSIFYLLPISLATVLANMTVGLIVSLLSAITWYLADILANSTYSHMLIPIWNAMMRLGYFSLHTFFLAKMLILYNQVKIASLTDPLTGIPNWRLFTEIFERELKMARRTQKSFTLAYLDLDNFKKLNDNFGHAKGDACLIMVSQEMIQLLRPLDIVARIGGDEFIILLPDTNLPAANEVLNRLNTSVLNRIAQEDWPVTLSIGALTFGDFNMSAEEMIKRVDQLMYGVKKSGKRGIKLQEFHSDLK